MKMITAAWLDKQGACPASLERFKQLFGDGCLTTLPNVKRWLSDDPFKTAAQDLGWLTLRLVGRKRMGFQGFYDLQIAGEVLQHLGIDAQTDWNKAYSVLVAIVDLPKRRLAKAIVEIAERSPNL